MGDAKDMKNKFRKLTECVLSLVLLPNRKRIGEIQYLKLSTYNSDISHYQQEEFVDSLSDGEKILTKNFKRVVTAGKGSKPVAILFPKKYQDLIDIMLNYREKCVPKTNGYLFANPRSDNRWLSGYHTLKKLANEAEVQDPVLFTSTRLRKQISTILQVHQKESITNDNGKINVCGNISNDLDSASYKSSPPPEIDFSEFELSTPSDKEIETTSDEKYSKTSTANFKEEISSFLKIKQKEPKERACENFIAWNVKKNKRLVTQIAYQNSNDIECFNEKDTFSPVDDSDEDPSFSPSQYRKRKKRRFCEISSNSSGSSRRSSSIHYHRSSSEQTQKPIIRKLENFPENLSISQFILLSDEKNSSVDVSKRSNGENFPKHSNLDKNDNFQKNYYDQISYIDSKYLNETHDHSSENQPVTRNEANLINKIEKKPKRKPDYCYFCEQ
ncbi:uncharacterized protein [Leptinotarsa decemlineata]|uniref:uncharacterized protein n=1 Tax=Leptinotarsa decemlineata TaxID=7539 RepID=UPI003D30966C